MKKILLATTLIALPLVTRAQPVTGLYVAAGAGVNLMQPEKVEDVLHQDAYNFGPFASVPAHTHVFRGQDRFDPGAVGVASIGYGLGNGLRLEVEGDYRYNNYKNDSFRYGEEKFGGMANALFDLDIGLPYVFPYVGAGAGYMWTERSFDTNKRLGSFAYQGIAGAAFPLPWVPGLSATLEYRFMGLAGTKETTSYDIEPMFTDTTKYYNNLNHSLLVGIRYAFNTPTPPPPVIPTPAPVPLVQPARTYLVFFDWDRADLTDRARQIIAEAASASARVQTTRIEVQGNADRSGTPAYNQALSLRRAQSVAAELVRLGVAKAAIEIEAFGDTRPLVPTAAGVREPQNRRVAIILR